MLQYYMQGGAIGGAVVDPEIQKRLQGLPRVQATSVDGAIAEMMSQQDVDVKVLLNTFKLDLARQRRSMTEQGLRLLIIFLSLRTLSTLTLIFALD
jgi:hypothetical protein